MCIGMCEYPLSLPLPQSQGNGGFTLVDFTIPTRDAPISHFPTEAPLCNEVHLCVYSGCARPVRVCV